MSTEKPILDHSEVQCQPGTHIAGGMLDSSRQNDANERNEAIVAAISHDLDARSADASKLMRHGVNAVRQSEKMIAYSRQAIAESRMLLAKHTPATGNPQPDRHAGSTNDTATE